MTQDKVVVGVNRISTNTSTNTSTKNLPRAEAKAAGQKFFSDGQPCPLCGCEVKYVSNGVCSDCTKAKAIARYAALDDAGRAAHKKKDHDRYLLKLAQSATSES